MSEHADCAAEQYGDSQPSQEATPRLAGNIDGVSRGQSRDSYPGRSAEHIAESESHPVILASARAARIAFPASGRSTRLVQTPSYGNPL